MNPDATPPEATTPPPTVSVQLKRSWGQAYSWVGLNPCPYCAARHRWPVPKGVDPATLLGVVLSPCDKGFVLLVRD